ncbi:hypothetical protein Scep_005131 [Stephania cephalantha]|uniref:Uncharacterized protein n=1 Tax=Stephania cephalantha TaxID=152367 RepID=A0AAP0PW26_9MAGN
MAKKTRSSLRRRTPTMLMRRQSLMVTSTLWRVGWVGYLRRGGGSERRAETEEGGRRRGGRETHGREWTSVARGGDFCRAWRGHGARSGVSQQQQRQWYVVACGGPVVRQNSGDGGTEEGSLRRRRRKEQRRRLRHQASVAKEWKSLNYDDDDGWPGRDERPRTTLSKKCGIWPTRMAAKKNTRREVADQRQRRWRTYRRVWLVTWRSESKIRSIMMLKFGTTDPLMVASSHEAAAEILKTHDRIRSSRYPPNSVKAPVTSSTPWCGGSIMQ